MLKPNLVHGRGGSVTIVKLDKLKIYMLCVCTVFLKKVCRGYLLVTY